MARKDPYLNCNFLLELGSLIRAAFQECSGFDSTIDVTEYREGGDNRTPRKLAGQTKHSNITLKWGLTDDMELYDWHQNAVDGDVKRMDGAIVVVDRKNNDNVLARWEFTDAWPTKYTGPDFNAGGSDVAVETLELAHEGLKRKV